MNRWFTSDPHFGHANIIGFCNRPFDNVESMNAKIIANWNSRVKPEDEVYMLGDWCFTEKSQYWENQLNGKIIYVKGNHDRNNGTKAIIESMKIYYGDNRILLIHDPERVTHTGICNFAFTGHIHTKWKIKRYRRDFDFVDCINVGMDVWGFKPVSYNEIMSRYSKWLKTNEGKCV